MTLVFSGVTAATAVISSLQGLQSLPWLQDYSHLLVGMLLLGTAMQMAKREPDGMRRYGIDLGGVLAPAEEPPPPGIGGAFRDLMSCIIRALPAGAREGLLAVGVAAIVFPPFAYGFHFWHAPEHPFTFHLPSDLPSYLAAQLLIVALPEEALFRGYFQTRLADRFTSRVNLLGVSFCPLAVVIQAVLFAAVHFAADPSPTRLAVFFPALLFGWMRSWRDGIGIVIVFHALCNLFSDILVRGWL